MIFKQLDRQGYHCFYLLNPRLQFVLSGVLVLLYLRLSLRTCETQGTDKSEQQMQQRQ